MFVETMDIVITLFYILFCICIIYPPTEFVAAGFTIEQLFETYLGSENTNFIGYHMKRITFTVLIHSFLPLGYILSLWLGGVKNDYLLSCAAAFSILPVLALMRIAAWWDGDRRTNPGVKSLVPYALPGSDWRLVAAELNIEFKSVDKVIIELGTTSKFVATTTWLIKVSQYRVSAIKQSDCQLVAVATDSYTLAAPGEDEMQYLNIEAVSSRDDVKGFTLRMNTASLRDLQPRLLRPVRVPEHLTLLPTLVERFVTVFKQHIQENPIYYCDEEPELCIGCMQATADVKLQRLCDDGRVDSEQSCQTCNCRVVWCALCLARWWAARMRGPPPEWLAARGSCPVCRARFCLRDVCLARRRPA